MAFNVQQQSLLDDLALVDDPQERLAAAVDRARRRPPLGPADRTPTYRVPGCTSHVWLVPSLVDGVCQFYADADSPLVRGLVVLLADFFSGSSPSEILATDTDPLEVLDLTRHLSPTRRHGLAAVRTAIRHFAQCAATAG